MGLIVGRVRFFLGLLASGIILANYSASLIGMQNLLGYPKALLLIETSEADIAALLMQNFRGELMLFGLDLNLVHKVASVIFAAGIF